MMAKSTNPTIPPDHGSASMYERYGCRCEECNTAHTIKVREYRIRRREREAGRG